MSAGISKTKVLCEVWHKKGQRFLSAHFALALALHLPLHNRVFLERVALSVFA